jgi:hypothetical protein
MLKPITQIYLITLAVAFSISIGAYLGWNCPYFRFPVLTHQTSITVK